MNPNKNDILGGYRNEHLTGNLRRRIHPPRLEEIEQAMGAAFIERHWDALCDLSRFRDYANFREGFRLGVALMLEACGPSA